MAIIKFVRKYDFYGSTAYDAVYMSGRVFTFIDRDLPKTVKRWVKDKPISEQYDNVYKRWETYYG